MTHLPKTILTHVTVALAYLALNAWFVVTATDYNPIGTGIRLLICTAIHLLVTLTLCVVNWRKYKLHLIVVIGVLAVIFFADRFIWDWVWELR